METQAPRPAPQPQPMNNRDRMFAALFIRVTQSYAAAVPPSVRRAIEFLLLLKAFTLFTALVYTHAVFSKQRNECLSHIMDSWPRHGVLRVEILKNHTDDYELKDSYIKEYGYERYYSIMRSNINNSKIYTNTPQSRVKEVQLFTIKSNSTPNSFIAFLENTFFQRHPGTAYYIDENGVIHTVPRTDKHTLSEQAETADSLIDGFLSAAELELFTQMVWPEEKYIVEYALEYGLLRLSPHMREKLNISVLLVPLDMDRAACLGFGFKRFILSEFLGYDDVLMSSIKVLAEKENNKGYFRNVVTNEHYRFVGVWMTRTSYIAAAFVMFIFSLSISMLLRYSHHQILYFIIDLLNMIESNAALHFPVAPLLTILLALVGMEAIMSEFFNDTVTAFYIIVIVWLADQFDAVCCHTRISKKYWLRFFFLYHFTFYAYHYRFNGQYSALALITSWLFIQHSMIYFYHHYEIPAIQRNNIHHTFNAQVNVHEHQTLPPNDRTRRLLRNRQQNDGEVTVRLMTLPLGTLAARTEPPQSDPHNHEVTGADNSNTDYSGYAIASNSADQQYTEVSDTVDVTQDLYDTENSIDTTTNDNSSSQDDVTALLYLSNSPQTSTHLNLPPTTHPPLSVQTQLTPTHTAEPLTHTAADNIHTQSNS